MPHAESYTEFTPDKYPAFPEGDFKTVSLETISLKKLLDNDDPEQDRVFEACKTRGFFYLELAGCESGEIINKGADDICRVAERFFQLPQEEKDKQRMQKGQLDGYALLLATYRSTKQCNPLTNITATNQSAQQSQTKLAPPIQPNS